jgi:hypothetical protein
MTTQTPFSRAGISVGRQLLIATFAITGNSTGAIGKPIDRWRPSGKGSASGLRTTGADSL